MTPYGLVRSSDVRLCQPRGQGLTSTVISVKMLWELERHVRIASSFLKILKFQAPKYLTLSTGLKSHTHQT